MSTVEGLTPDRRRALTRAHLMAAAAEVFGEKGYAHASLDEIAKRAGFTKGAVYSNFDNKEELFIALVSERKATMMHGFFEAGTAADITDVFQRLAPTPSEWMLFEEFALFAWRRPDLRERLLQEDREMFEQLVVLVAERMPPDARISARDLAHLYAAVFDALARRRSFDPEAVPDDLFARLLDYLAP